jgi:sugar (pentulose or hexulose) kinase
MGTSGGAGWLLGIDIGTTGVRGAVIDTRGGIVAEAS